MANEFRVDPVTGATVVISTGRGGRPTDYVSAKPGISPGATCPFCPGNEKITPPTITLRGSEGEAWRVRCFDNKFNALDFDAKRPFKWAGKAPFIGSPAFGKHEVIVETPNHGMSMGSLDEGHLTDVFSVYKERTEALLKDFPYVLIFQNYGREAGASLSHLHAQLCAFPLVPEAFRRKLEGVAMRRKKTGRCVYCDILKAERKAGERMVFEDEHFAVICPWASAFRYQTIVLPKKHGGGYDFPIAAFARTMGRLVRAYEKALGDISYNYVVNVSPRKADLHFHVDFMPKLATPAGFEYGSGIYINSTRPEDAAAALRGALAPE